MVARCVLLTSPPYWLGTVRGIGKWFAWYMIVRSKVHLSDSVSSISSISESPLLKALWLANYLLLGFVWLAQAETGRRTRSGLAELYIEVDMAQLGSQTNRLTISWNTLCSHRRCLYRFELGKPQRSAIRRSRREVEDNWSKFGILPDNGVVLSCSNWTAKWKSQNAAWNVNQWCAFRAVKTARYW